MVVTSRGGVGCCWVKSLVRLTEYHFPLFGAASVSCISSRGPAGINLICTKYHKARGHVNNEILRSKIAGFWETRHHFAGRKPTLCPRVDPCKKIDA